jgi:hypothetical protein
LEAIRAARLFPSTRRRRRLWSAGALLAASTFAAAAASDKQDSWVAQGPGPITQGQVEGIEDGEVVGAVHTVAAHPRDADILYVGGVNGGVWKTERATKRNIKWARLTDDQQSLSIGALEFDPTDRRHRTLVAGIGRYSSFQSTGGARLGLLRTTDAGKTWTALDGGGVLVNKNVSGVAARGSTLVISVNTATPFTFPNIGIWRSADGGASFQQIASGTGAATGLPGGVTHDLVGNPNRPTQLFTSVVFADSVGGVNGLYRSNDTGATWVKVSTPEIDALLTPSNVISNVEFAVGRHDNVYAAICRSGRLAGVFRSADAGATWSNMGVPLTNEGILIGAHPGGQASIHLSIAADPRDPNVVYLGGDRQPLFNEGSGQPTSFPNSLGAEDFSGRLFRGDASRPAGSEWVHLTHSSSLGAAGGGTASMTSPHADSREMAVDADGNLIEVDDGGIYKRTEPRSNAGDWFTLNGDLQTTEMHDVVYDANARIALSGDQDTGTPMQRRPRGETWDSFSTADGGDVAVDAISTPGVSVRYTSFQNLGGFRRSFWDAQNTLLAVETPALTRLDGTPRPQGQFVTPLAVNAVDGLRLLIGAANGLYESFDRGDTVTRVATTRANGTGLDPVAYGATDNPDAVYIGSAALVFVRAGAPPAPLVQSATFPGTTTVTDVVIDPDAGNTAFVVTTTSVFRTADAGATWTDVTGNLTALGPTNLRSVAFVRGDEPGHLGDGRSHPRERRDAVIVGSQNGVFFATDESGFTLWRRLGSDLPAVPVFDLHYSRPDDVLLAGTMGRGAWRLRRASRVVSGGHP